MTTKKNTPENPTIVSKTFTRRRLLKGAAALGAAAAAQALMPFNVQRVLAQGSPTRGSLADIKHVVLLMQENRSFDHYFGTLAMACADSMIRKRENFRRGNPCFISRTQ